MLATKSPLPAPQAKAFSLIELLVAISVLTLLVTLLATILTSALNIWGSNEQKSDLQQQARSAINIMRRDLQQIALPADKKATSGLQLLINPPGLDTKFSNRDSIFFQAPVASNREAGDLAIVGYFVQKGGTDGETFQLCRLLVNPGDDAHLLTSDPDNWLTDNLLKTKASPSEINHLHGLFIENVPGLWITPYDRDNTPITPSLYDSRTKGNLPPARIKVSLALLDSEGAARVKAGAIILPDAQTCTDAEAFLSLATPQARKHIEIVTFNVLFPL